ncbi:MAG: cysteine hydrolase [Rhodospirillaceae bacterium]|jgi:biuret amidohydrolase|nr:cysteine hydrolase [Rhodospirillaceae bacterium]MBT4487670.1 cysteine hydrolase [Rhodospirillaceae bacterium]MBT5190928.1 cysteine hydrolase [Rhodospirillaceae bacterium]MBT5899043.1 cysteine hydrolase [Rhodospirillaceae bacterium]MBT6430030.1 cysteine hydrolase [Rhodospirillaceae bacterium]
MPTTPDNDYIQAFMTERAPDFSRAALIVVDMQYATGHRDGALGRRLAAEGSNVGGYRFARIEALVVPNMKRLLDRFRKAKGAVIYLTVGADKADCSDAPPHMINMFRALDNFEGSREHEIIDELKPHDGESVINKTTIGAFASTGIDHLLRSMGRDQLYMGGVSTNMCVDTTAREAADRGYGVTLIEDACATTHEDLHDATITNFQRLFGRVISTDEAMAELGADSKNV